MQRFGQDIKNEDDNAENRPQPLRQFSDGPSEAPPGARDRTRLIAYWALPLLVLLFIIIAGLYLVLSDSSKSVIPMPEDSDALEEVAIAPSIPTAAYTENSGPAGLLNAYLDAIGGRGAVERIQSVRYEGDVLINGVSRPFRLIVLKPDKGMLVTYDEGGAAVKYKLNGDKAWMLLDQEDGSRIIKKIEEKQIEALKWSLRVDHTFRRMALAGQAAGLSVDEIEYMGKPCFEVTKMMPDSSEFLAILEEKSLLLLKTRERVGIGKGQIMEVVYDDYKMISGVMEPYTTKLYRDGELDNTVHINSIRFNMGFISSLFNVPDELEE